MLRQVSLRVLFATMRLNLKFTSYYHVLCTMTSEINIYHANMSDVHHSLNCQCCLLLKTSLSNSNSLLFNTRLLMYAVLFCLDRCCTCEPFVDLNLLDCVCHHNWHRPMAFFCKPFRLRLKTLSLAYGNSLFLSLFLFLFVFFFSLSVSLFLSVSVSLSVPLSVSLTLSLSLCVCVCLSLFYDDKFCHFIHNSLWVNWMKVPTAESPELSNHCSLFQTWTRSENSLSCFMYL